MHNLFYDAVVQIDAGSEAHHALAGETHHRDFVYQGCQDSRSAARPRGEEEEATRHGWQSRTASGGN